MLFLNISLPSISGHFRFDSGQCNSSATHISSLQGFAPAFLRYSSPLLILSTLSFSVAPHIQTQLFLCVPKRLRAFPWHIFSVLFLSSSMLRFTIPLHCPAIQCRCHPMQFSSVATPCLSVPMPIVTLLYNSLAIPNISPAVLVPSQLSSSSAFIAIHRHCVTVHRRAIPLPSHTTLFPCSSNRFNGIHFLYMAFLFIALPPPIYSLLFPRLSVHCSTIPMRIHAFHLHSRAWLIRATPSPFPALPSFSIAALLRSTP